MSVARFAPLVLTATASGKRFTAGVFTQPSLKELREQFNEKKPALRAAMGSGRLQVDEIVGDVSALHAQSENAGTAF